MRRTVLATITAAALVALAIPAHADHGSITDKKGDTLASTPAPKADYDIVSAAWGHRSNGRLMHKVTVAGQIGDPAAGMGALPRLMIDVPGQKFDNPTCDFFIELTPPGVGPNTSTDWKYYVKTCENSGARIKGPASGVRVNAHTIRIVFKRKRIGSPSHYGWRFEFPADGDSPPYDQAPNNGGYKRHDI